MLIDINTSESLNVTVYDVTLMSSDGLITRYVNQDAIARSNRDIDHKPFFNETLLWVVANVIGSTTVVNAHCAADDISFICRSGERTLSSLMALINSSFVIDAGIRIRVNVRIGGVLVEIVNSAYREPSIDEI